MSQLVNQLKVLCQSVFKVTFYKMFVLGGGGGGGGAVSSQLRVALS